MKRPLAYITAHWGDNEFENTENAAKYCRLVYEAGFSPVCPLLFLPLFLKDSIPRSIRTGSTWPATISAALRYWWSAAVRWMRP